MELAPGDLIGKYAVRRKIGEGGMAEIYLAVQRGPEGFERELCIKKIREFLSTDAHFRDMFVAEARIAANLNHPNIVQVFDFDQTGDGYYIAMEFVHGRSLADVRNRAREKMHRMAPLLALHVGGEVAKGLAHAHRYRSSLAPTGVVHRDVTPHNVLISYSGDVKLTDFGIAKMGSRASTSGSIKGKFAYMSPEQARGDDVDPRTDVFALGIVMWELFTGARLFDGDSDTKVIKAVQESAIAPPSRLNPEVPADLSDLVMKALERDAARRFADGYEMASAMRSALFAHGKDVATLSLADYMRELFGDPSEHTNVVPVPSRSGDTARLEKANPDDNPIAPTVIRASSGEAPPALDAPAGQGPITVSGRPRNRKAAEEALPSVEVSAVQSPPRPRSVVLGAGVAVFLSGVAFAVYLWSQSRPTANAPDERASASRATVPEPAPTPASTPAPKEPVEAKPVVDAVTSKPSAGEGAGGASEARHSAGDVHHPSKPASPTKPQKEVTIPAGHGTLHVVVTPWATVFIDGKSVGDGPGEWPVAAGHHSIRMLNAESGIDKTVMLNVVAGKYYELNPQQ